MKNMKLQPRLEIEFKILKNKNNNGKKIIR